MQRRRGVAIIALLVTTLVLSVVLSLLFAGDRLTYVADSYADKNFVYLIDDDGEKIDIIKMDKRGKADARIKIDKISGNLMTSLDYLTLDGENIYIYRIDREITSNRVLSEGVFLCDFKSEKLRDVWSLPVIDDTDQNNYSIQVSDGILSYFTIGYDTENFKAQAIVHTMQPESTTPEAIAIADYDIGIGFADFFYGDNGRIAFSTPEGNIFVAFDPDTVSDAGILMTDTSFDDMSAVPELTYFDETVSNEGEPALDVEAIAEEQLQEASPGDSADLNGVPHFIVQKVFPTAESGYISRIANFTSDGLHTVYFTDVDRRGFYSISLETGEESVVINSWSDIVPTDNTLELSGFNYKNVRFTDSLHFTAMVTDGGDSGIVGIYDNGELSTFKKVSSAGQFVKTTLKYFLQFAAAFLVLFLIIFLIYRLAGGKFPIVTKVIAACIPIVIISVLLLQTMMNSIFTEQITDNQYKELYLVSRQQLDGISSTLLSEIDLDDPYSNIYYYELRSLLTALPLDSTIYERNSAKNKNKEIHNFGYYWLHKLNSNGKLTTIFCEESYINTPIEYYYDEATAQIFYDAASNNKTYRGTFTDMWGEWICLAIPVTDENGTVIAVLETGMPKASLTYTVRENARRVNTLNLIILLILVVVLSILLLITLSPLKRLKEGINDIIHGNLGVQTKVKGNDEIAEISEIFNQMSSSVEYSVNELERLNQGYFKFVPSKMFSLLRKSSVTDVRLGDQMNSDIAILSFNAVGFQNMISSMNSSQMFGFINEVYSELVPIVSDKGGVVDKFEDAGLIAFYTGGSEDAVGTAISVCQAMDIANSRRVAEGFEPVEMTSGISYGPVMVGIVGHEQRLAATTVSEHTNLSGYLRRKAPKYCSRILTTAATIDRIEGFSERFNARFIGFLHVTASDTTEKLYDVFDGDSEDVKLLKKQTKELFEKGVALYCEKDYYEARLVFIEVLKKFRMDGAAKEYLYRCDKYYQRENNDDVTTYIEEY